MCFDESEKCRDFAQQGKCTNSALHEYANFCRRSCGLCGMHILYGHLKKKNRMTIPNVGTIFGKDVFTVT